MTITVKHSLEMFVTGSTGVPNLPEFVVATVVDGILVGYCNSDKKIVEPKQDWVKTLFENDPQHFERYTQQCFEIQPSFFKATIYSLRQRFNQSEDVHILQRMSGCDWDVKSGAAVGFMQYGYNGEDFISFDLKTLTWIAPKPQAVSTKLRWDAEKARITYTELFLTQICPVILKKYMDYGKSSLLRRELPSVSLLQKTPSSPVSCHATGFYPDRAALFWRKDGEEIHEEVDHGEILPNHDGSFQMSVDLNISSVTPEDWRRYECVFELSGVKDDIVTRLDKAVIRTNQEKLSDMTIAVVPAVVVLGLIFTATGFIVYKRKKALDNSSELSEELNPAVSMRPPD
ncbi:major histocompatibility complex class I-related gene protein-like [Symphorus nematophorus]